MLQSTRKNKRSIPYRQFQGGYTRVLDVELQALLLGYQRGDFRRNEVRVFAGRLEQAALHEDSTVSLYRIVNCHSQRRGNRRLSEGEIQTASQKLDQMLPNLVAATESKHLAGERQPQLKPVARKVLRHIARGGATTVEALFCLAYFLRRIPQRKPMQRLQYQEYYARLTYAEFEAWSGVCRATTSRILQRLIDRGYLNTVPVAKQNENRYGQLFIDGPMISLVRPRQSARRRKPKASQPQATSVETAREKKSIPSRDLINSPIEKKSTLRNVNPKTEIQEEERLVLGLKEGFLGRHANPELQRIAQRAAQMVENGFKQAA